MSFFPKINPFGFFRGFLSPDDYLKQKVNAATFFSDSEEVEFNDFALADEISLISFEQEQEFNPFSFIKNHTETANNSSLYFLKKAAKKLKQLLPIIMNALNGKEKIFQSINVTGIIATPIERTYTVGFEKENRKKVSLTFSVKSNEFHKNEVFHVYPEGARPIFEDERSYTYLPLLNLFTWRLKETKTEFNIIIEDPHNPCLQDKPIKKSFAVTKKERINLIFRDPHSKNKDLHKLADSVIEGSKSGFNCLRSVFTKMIRSKSAPIILDAKSRHKCFIHFKEHE
jgi:hypothetical protein